MADIARPEIVRGLRESKKYESLSEDTLTRIADWSLARHSGRREVLKAAKRKLHQTYAAYLDQVDLSRVEALLDELPEAPTNDVLRRFGRETLSGHASSAERLPFLDAFYHDLFQVTGIPETMQDVACGLGPFGIPWMGTNRPARYHAYEIDCRLTGLINRYFGALDLPQLAECRDVLVSPPTVEVDLTLLLKSVPCLEQQEKNSAIALLRKVRSRWVAVSFPTESLGGRNVGMRRSYDTLMAHIASELDVSPTELGYATETVYLYRTRFN